MAQTDRQTSCSFAFTLAEVLLTLGIIGVVAAMTLPVLIANYQQSQTISQVKKAYSMLTQAALLSKNDNGDFSGWDWGDGSGSLTALQSFNTYWAPYLQITKYCSVYSDCGYTSATPWYYAQDSTVNDATQIVNIPTRTTVLLNNGSLLFINVKLGARDIVIDLNAGLPPNRYGKDVFWMTIDNTRGIVPSGYTLSPIDNYCARRTATGTDGQACLQKIIADGWTISSNYPW